MIEQISQQNKAVSVFGFNAAENQFGGGGTAVDIRGKQNLHNYQSIPSSSRMTGQ